MAIAIHPDHRITRLLGAAVCALIAAGCAATTQPTSPEADRAEMIKKLPPAEIQSAADEAARQGDYERAVTLYNQAIEIQPSADLWFRVGWIYSHLGKKPMAARAYLMTIQYDPQHARAREELGLLYMEGKQRDEAVAQLDKATEIDPTRWRAHNALGVLADASGDHEGAVRHYEAALAVVPKSTMVMNNFGYSYYLIGDYAQADKIYQQALALSPRDRAVLANVGVLRARQADYEGAVEILSSTTDKAKAYNDVGYIAFQNGDLDKATELLNEAIRVSPTYYETARENLKRVQRAKEAAAASRTADAS